jgi:hypothetical protein
MSGHYVSLDKKLYTEAEIQYITRIFSVANAPQTSSSKALQYFGICPFDKDVLGFAGMATSDHYGPFGNPEGFRKCPDQLGICGPIDRRRSQPDLQCAIVLADNSAF